MSWALLKAYGAQVFIAVDQLCNALIPPIDGTLSYADETLSARSYRAHRDGKIMGKVFMPLIDLLFFWQGPHISAKMGAFGAWHYFHELHMSPPR